MIKCVDIFCGLGGLTHGLALGGVKVVAGVDIDKNCRFPFEQNNRARFIQKSVAELSGSHLQKLWGQCKNTLLAGCAPCQPFSTYSRKNRQGLEAKQVRDERWPLVREFARLIGEASPKFVTMENVPQLIDHPVFEDFLAELSNYHVSYGIVDCESYGVPQTRKRLVLLASQLGNVSLLPPDKFKHHAHPTVRNAISHLPSISAGGSDPGDCLHSAPRLSDLNLRRIKASIPGGSWRDWPTELRADCHIRTTGDTYPSVYGRMQWDAPAPTITTQCFGFGNGRFGHPEQDRAISLREAAILQTFPQTYQFVAEKQSVRYAVLGRLIGNAVPVKLGEVIAKSFVDHLGKS